MRVDVRVLVIVLRRQPRDDLDPAVLHAAHRQDAVRDPLEVVRPSAHHDDLEAQVVREVNMQRGPNTLAKLVLQLGEPLAEIADVMIVDQGQGPDRLDPLRHLGARDGGARKVA
jgi:hypothetical protein